MKVAVVQMDSRTDKERNIAAACRCVLKAAEAEAKLVVLPEVFSYRGPLDGASLQGSIAETLGGATVQAFCGLAKKKKIGIVLGSIYERIPKIKKMYNTSVVVSPRRGGPCGVQENAFIQSASSGKGRVRRCAF